MVGKGIKKILLNNITLALIVGLPFVFFINRFIDKYSLELTGPLNLDEYKYLYYNDCDKNGESDQIFFGENQLGNIYCKIYDPVHRGQFNVRGRFPESEPSPYFCDINEDGFDEVIFFSQNDSTNVFINIVNYVNGTINEFELCKVGVPGKRDFGASIWDYTDLNRDGQKEIIITVAAGFALQPRAIYSLNPVTKELKRTPGLGSKLGAKFIADLDGDGYREIVCGTFTSQNYNPSVNFPYDDNWTRLFVFDHNLNFKFEPLQFSTLRSRVIVYPYNLKDSNLIYAFIDYRGDTLQKNKHFLINSFGDIVKEELFVNGKPIADKNLEVFRVGKELMTLDFEGTLNRFDSDLKLHSVKKLEQYKNCFVRTKDINSNGFDEKVLTDKETGEITIAEDNFTHPVSFYLPGNIVRWLTPVVSNNGENKYLIRSSKGHFLISYYKNPYWNFRYLFYFLVFGFIYLLLFVLNKIQAYKLKEKLRVERELQELQYRAITSQFSPHYTFNVLNTLSAQVYNEEKPEIYNYFSKFIRQLRYLYDDKNAVTRSLKEEIDFCRDYLDIQKMRFPEKFEYKIEVEESLTLSVQIPKMMLHTFVENAFKHGIRPYEKGGLITISIRQREPFSPDGRTTRTVPSDSIIVTITDNGIGRAAAKEYAQQNPQFSSGRGLEMLHEFIVLFNQGKKEKIEIETTDLLRDEKPVGTKIQIFIPI